MRKVGIFIDHENLSLSLIETKKGRQYNIEALMERAREEGRVIVGKAYVPFLPNTPGRNNYDYKFYKNGVDPVYTPVYESKSLGDPMLICDVMEILCENQNIDIFIICSGDKDVVPLLRKIAEKGKEAIVIGVGPTSAQILCEECDNLKFRFEDYLSLHRPVPRSHPPHRNFRRTSNGEAI